MTRSVTIYQTPNYALISYGNGWAYLFKSLADNRSVWFQDDDASTFRTELDAYEEHCPNSPLDSILGSLWADYECVSQEDAQSA